MRQYIIKSGDNFFLLARQNGCCCQDLIDNNPGVDPCNLQIGQIIDMPENNIHSEVCADIMSTGFKGRCDDVVVEVEGVKFKVTRAGEPAVPHEVHLILPRTEIRKVQYPGNGVVETTIMLSNINIVNSPRFHGEDSVKIDTIQNFAR